MENNYNLLDKIIENIDVRIKNIDNKIKKGDIFYETISNASKKTIYDVFDTKKEILEGLERIIFIYNRIIIGDLYLIEKIGTIRLSHLKGSTNINTLCKYINLVDTRNTVIKNQQDLIKHNPRLEEFRIDALGAYISTLTEAIEVIISKINKGE